MNETEIKDTLQLLARIVVRNEIVNEYFLRQERPATVDALGAKVREVTAQLQDTDLAQRFPKLFPLGEISCGPR